MKLKEIINILSKYFLFYNLTKKDFNAIIETIKKQGGILCTKKEKKNFHLEVSF